MPKLRTVPLYFGLLTVTIFSVFLVAPVLAQSPPGGISDDEVNAVAKELYCPVCESTPLDVCPTQACADWREVIRTKLGEGQTAEEIEAYFALQYGARALAEPPREGFTLAIWIVPISLIIVAVLLFGRYLYKIRKVTPPVFSAPLTDSQMSADADIAQDDYEARIEEELRERYS